MKLPQVTVVPGADTVHQAFVLAVQIVLSTF